MNEKRRGARQKLDLLRLEHRLSEVIPLSFNLFIYKGYFKNSRDIKRGGRQKENGGTGSNEEVSRAKKETFSIAQL
jgi:hypothetical protein